MIDASKQDMTVSVAVLNHRRPSLLLRVLTAISQLDYPAFEVIVVGDLPDLASYVLPDVLADQVQYVHFAEPNICRARNLAVQASGGTIVAFIDDDAAPEPTWLNELVKPFEDPRIATAGGTVRSSDGVTIEWQGGLFDRSGQETGLTLTQDITTRTAEEQRATGNYLGLRGVNSAFRRAALVQTGGFDEAIRYYLDETDMALRLTEAGWSSATARRAEVHHLLVPNATRGLLRRPGNQYEIGAGKAVFCAKHAPKQVDHTLRDFQARRIAMLDAQMRLGIVRTLDRERVKNELEQGIVDGLSRTPEDRVLVMDPAPAFRAFKTPHEKPRLNIAIDTGWNPATNQALVRFARVLAANGHRVSLFSFKSGPKALRVNYRDGMWLHSGGTWTFPATGEKPAITRHNRAKAERARIHKARQFDITLSARNSPESAGFIDLPGCRQKVTMLANDTFQADAAYVTALLQSVADGPRAMHDRSKNSMDTVMTRPISASEPAT